MANFLKYGISILGEGQVEDFDVLSLVRSVDSPLGYHEHSAHRPHSKSHPNRVSTCNSLLPVSWNNIISHLMVRS